MSGDIWEAISRFRASFEALDLEAPDIVTFERPEAWSRFLRCVQQQAPYNFSTLSPTPLEVEIIGMKFRFAPEDARQTTLAERNRIVALVRRHAEFKGLTPETQNWADWLAHEIGKQDFTRDELMKYGPGLMLKREAPK